MRGARRFGDEAAVNMVLRTCDAMARGGIHDQLGGGFARYSVDAQWLVPHFEKMLYDNAQLVHLYLDAHLAAQSGAPEGSPGSRFADTARGILDYVLRDMTHPDGGFYSAEDADSEGHEGKFYCWTHEELSKLLSPEEFIVAANYFGITKEGNFVDHSHPQPLPGQNVLSVVNSVVLSADVPLLESAKAKMLAARSKRVRPHRDDKVLASWNGLMLGAFARASAVLGEGKYRAAAEKNLKFLREKLWVKATVGTLFHRWCDGERDNVQLLEGHAFLLAGAIELYEATLEPAHLDFACELASALVATFYDHANGGFWQSPAGAGDLILRIKDDYDGAEPSGNSVATLALLKLAAITDREDFRQPAEATLQFSSARLAQQPAALAFMLHALDFWLDPPRRVVLCQAQESAGDEASAILFNDLLQAAHSVYQPNKIVLGNVGAVEPFAKTMQARNEATAFVCTGTACQPPVTDPASLQNALR
jgi:uncharacterized protein YyaL (SSP411 family)